MFDFNNISTPSKFFSKLVTGTWEFLCRAQHIRSIASAFEMPLYCFTFHQYATGVNYDGNHTRAASNLLPLNSPILGRLFCAYVLTDNSEHRDQQIPLQLEQHKCQSLLFLRLFEPLLLQRTLRYL